MARREKEQNQLYHYNPEPSMRPVRHFYCKVDRGIQPCAPVSPYVQVPTVVAPVAIVPYATEDQPLWQDATEYY